MAQQGPEKIKTVEDIFHTMDYGNITEGTDILQLWLESKNRLFSAYTEDNVPLDKKYPITDINSNKQIATVCELPEGHVKKVVDLLNPEWGKKKKIERAVLMKRLATEIERHSTLICQLEMAVRGILTTDTRSKGLPILIEYLHYYSSWAVKCEEENKKDKTTVSFVGLENFLGVFGMILGPSLAAGYSIIICTDPVISLIAFLLVELAENIGFPKNTIKVIPRTLHLLETVYYSYGANIISIFSRDSLILKNEALKYAKFLPFPCIKIPTIVFNTGDLDSACDSIVESAWGYQGVFPGSTDLVIVQEDIFKAFVVKLKNRVLKIRVGHSNNKTADVSCPFYGLLAKETQKRVIEDACALGIEVFQINPNDAAAQPTLLIGGRVYGNRALKNDSDIPAVTVIAFRTANEAVSLANNTCNGFGAIIWSENISLANEMARKLDVSNVWINTNVILNPAVPISSKKNSAGYFGGLEGLLEYTENPLPEPFIEKPECKLPKSYDNNPVQLFYGNSFQKSESGFVEGVYDYVVGADIKKAIGAAKKGHQTWRELTLLARTEVVRKAIEETCNDKCSKTDDWLLGAYEGIAELHNLGTASTHKTYDVRSIQEPVGVVGIEGMSAKAIIGSLLLGNAVVILLFLDDDVSFAVHMAKAFVAHGAPAGIFNIIGNCNKNALDGFFKQKDMNVFIANHSLAHDFDVNNPKHICYKTDKWSDIIRDVTYVKNIWTCVGDSLL